VIGRNRQQGQIAGTLDRFSDFSLVSGAVAGDTARNDLAAFGDEVAQCARLFIIDGQVFLGAETAYFSTLERAFSALAAWATLAA